MIIKVRSSKSNETHGLARGSLKRYLISNFPFPPTKLFAPSESSWHQNLFCSMASFEVPPATQEAISLAGGKAFSDNAFKALVEAVFACLSDPKQDSSAHFRMSDRNHAEQTYL
jgi:hypothetical protein